MSGARARLNWPDVLRLLGMWCIVIGHFSEYAVRFYPYVFIFHVPLFFFASGLFAQKQDGRTTREIVGRQAVRLLIPYLFYSLLCMAVQLIWLDGKVTDWLGYLMQMVLGRRNQISYGQALWFLPCLFVMNVLYAALRRVLPADLPRLLLCMAAGAAAKLVFQAPVLPWGVDTALRYLPYYALGDVLMPWLCKQAESKTRTMAGWGVGAVSMLAAVCLYWFGPQIINDRLAALPWLRDTAAAFGMAVLLVLSAVCASFVLQKMPALCKAGRYTLTVCGLESVLRILAQAVPGMLGLQLVYTNPLQVLLLSALIMAVGVKIGMLLEQHWPLWGGYPVK